MWNVVWLDGRARLLDTLNSPDMLYDAEHLKRLASGSHRQGGRAGLGSLSVPRSSIHRDPTDIYRESYDSDGDPEQHEGTNLLAHFERRQLFHGELVDVKCRRLGWVHGHVATSQCPGCVAVCFPDLRSGLLCRKHMHPESMNLRMPDASSGEDEHDPAGPGRRPWDHWMEPDCRLHKITWQLEDMLRPKKREQVKRPHPRPKSELGEGDIDYEEITFHELIGRGCCGAVNRGSVNGKVVAVKRCHVDDHQEAHMLLEECRYLRKLRHPRLVSMIGWCDKPPHVVMVLEYMSGGSLYNLLFNDKIKLEFTTKARMALQVAEGITYLHANSTVHRDLKTRNIIMDKQRNCKICDFGLTVTLMNTHIAVGWGQGSPPYLAPEQLKENPRITERADIWQMGCVMLELFCNSIPFSHCSNPAQIYVELVVRESPPAIPEDSDPRARVLVAACLRLQDHQRPTARDLSSALSAVCDSVR
eukprot:gnl/TRDRNA2_/TRDRNA2_176111_c0_seq15.p1 gnl/TRDRNA2_/TRDRNA2_176111_c0~~gnl/TRDRNA2_/TRDRNA2_176111_c0_seq15.p1  ORF type:complete len:502 (-),score=73.77 gnl/TRDRNA2_/TRDRNA2_176111_c0_seq15:367-1788(-)